MLYKKQLEKKNYAKINKEINKIYKIKIIIIKIKTKKKKNQKTACRSRYCH